jgi:lipopolysaccharide/colanic/teichoic acid biosynthesis glycosyltransferase
MKYINKSLTIQVFDHAITGRLKLSKWVEDRLIVILLLVLVAPLMLAIALAIRFESKGPVFVRQKRFGLNNKPIDVWKFRTARVPDRGRRGSSRRTAKGESTVTALGRFLRRSALDELPQLFNVLVGDMSIVGPRPLSAALAQKSLPLEPIIERCAAWHQIKPGVTGWAQVNGCYGDPNTAEKLKKELKHDLHYMENWSIFLDFWIILRTAVLVFKDRTVV